jgi:hypothetical protein
MTDEPEDIFTLVKAISKTKRDYFRDDATSERSNRVYVPFIVNKALSFHVDTILYSNEVNQRGHLPNLLQHDYLINTIRSRSRKPEKWPKPFEDKDIDAVMEYYGCNYNRAKEYLTILTKDQLSVIHDRIFKGGADDNRHIRDGRNPAKKP